MKRFGQRSVRALALGVAVSATVLAVGVAQASAPTWEDHGPISTQYWNAVAYGDGKFVAVSDASVNLMTSVDGATWVTNSAVTGNGWWRIAFGNGRFVALDWQSGAAYSDDGASWTHVSTPGAGNAIAFGAGRFVAVRDSDPRVMTSVDGGETSPWSPSGASISATTTNDGQWRDVAYGGGKFVAVSQGGNDRVMTSIDGLDWTVTHTAATDENRWMAVTHGTVDGQGRFVAVANDFSCYPGTPPSTSKCYTPIMWSATGSAWTRVTVDEDLRGCWNDIAFGQLGGVGTFIAVSDCGDHRVIKSTNGIDWDPYPGRSSVLQYDYEGIVYGSGVFVAVGGNHPSYRDEASSLRSPASVPTPAGPPPVFVPAPTTTTTTTPSTTTTTSGPRPPQTITVSPNGTGQLPDMTPGRITVTENGNEITTTFRRTGDAAWQLQGSNFDWKVDVPALRRTADSTNGFVTLLLGGQVQASGQGFEPGSMVDVWLFSDPVYIGSLPVGDDGTFDGELTVPANITPGTHTLQANGLTTDGNLRSMNIGVEVAEPRLQLPVTGNSGQPITGWAVALLAFGLAVLSYRRLNRRP